MKTVAGFGLLILLLSHSLGWAVAVLFAGATGETRELSEDLKSDASAWHRFAELSERMQEMQLSKTPPTPLGSVLKMLGDIAKTYLPGAGAEGEWDAGNYLPHRPVRFAEPFYIPLAGVFNRPTPPPEMIG